MNEKIKFTSKQTQEFKHIADNDAKQHLKKSAEKLFSDGILS